MFVLGNFLMALSTLLYTVLQVYIFIVIGRVVISWVNADPYNPVVRFLVQATEPVLYKIRSKLPSMGGFDLSPMILILAVIFIQSFVVTTLKQFAIALQ